MLFFVVYDSKLNIFTFGHENNNFVAALIIYITWDY